MGLVCAKLTIFDVHAEFSIFMIVGMLDMFVKKIVVCLIYGTFLIELMHAKSTTCIYDVYYQFLNFLNSLLWRWIAL